MTLSARDRRIITAIEQEVQERDPLWSRRFMRRHRAFARLERRQRHRVRRRVMSAVLIVAWVVLLGVDDAHGPGPWLWAALAVTAVALLAAGMRLHLRRHRYGRGLAGS